MTAHCPTSVRYLFLASMADSSNPLTYEKGQDFDSVTMRKIGVLSQPLKCAMIFLDYFLTWHPSHNDIYHSKHDEDVGSAKAVVQELICTQLGIKSVPVTVCKDWSITVPV
jgi:hypothetical protein